MTWSHDERLYNLLPAIYRTRDATQGQPLRALLSVIESELEAVEQDIDGLYADWFIETCDEWVVPYIGNLLGARALHTMPGAGNFSLRAYIANTLRYRRRKGTAPVLEQLARDVSGWPARVVEFYNLLVTSQYTNHTRPHNLGTPDLRDTNRLDLLATPFEMLARSIEVRHVPNQRGKYNLNNVGLFLWRLQSCPIRRSTAGAVSEPPDGRYTFNPVGMDAPLFNRPQTETEITHLAEEVNVPGELRRRALYDDVERVRQAIAEEGRPRSRYFGDQPVLQVFLDEEFVNDQPVPVPPEEILICDLSDWRRPPASKTYTRNTTQPDGAPVTEEVNLPISVAVDPVQGRLAFPLDKQPDSLQVSYAYGFSDDVGGGPYNRRESVEQSLTREVTWQVGVAQSPAITPVADESIFSSMGEAVQAWNLQPAGTVGVIAILDNYTYQENLTGSATIEIPEGSRLLLVAAGWPETDVPGELNQRERKAGRLTPTGLRPHIRGNISVRGTAPGENANAGELFLNGLLVEGELRVLVGNLGKLRVDHCTLVPDQGGLAVNASTTPASENNRLTIHLHRTITGPITLPEAVPSLQAQDSIIDAAGSAAIAASGSDVHIATSTTIGTTEVRSLDTSNSIFTAPVTVERKQIGCARFSYLPEGARTPRRYQCQPDLALKAITDPTRQASLRLRVAPSFTSMTHGDPAYAQLHQACAVEIRTGGEDGSEMGAFNHLKQPQREENLRAALNEYLRFGLEAGIFYVT